MLEPVEVDLLRVTRTIDDVMVVGVVIGSEHTDARERQIADGLDAQGLAAEAAEAVVFIDDLFEGIAVVHVVSDPMATDEKAAQIERTVATAVIAWFDDLGTPVRSVAVDARVILTADPDAEVEALDGVRVELDD